MSQIVHENLRTLFIVLLLPTLLHASYKIVGGSVEKISNSPYQLSIRRSSRHICGGSLISSKTAISAAHCFQIDGSYSIKAGVSNLDDPGTIVHIKLALIHPQYNRNSYDYDISILFLTEPLKFTDEIQPIALPTSDVEPGMIGKVSGWGTTSSSKRELISRDLRAVEVPVIDSKKCNQVYFHKITRRMFCAGYQWGGKDACSGDSGGPFVSDGVLYGVVSSGFDCALPNYPGIYTDVYSLRSFIKENADV